MRVGSPFTLKKENFSDSDKTPERNTTAIGFQQYLSQKSSLKTESVRQEVTSRAEIKNKSVAMDFPEQVVFSKEFKGKEKQMSIHQAKPQVHYLEGRKQFSLANNQKDEEIGKIERLNEEKTMEDEIKRKNTATVEKKKMEDEQKRQIIEETQRRQKFEVQKPEENEKDRLKKELEERKKILQAEKVRLESLEKEKNILKRKREQLQQEEEKERRVKDGIKQSLVQFSRREQQGVGFGSVQTGYVHNKKLSLLTRASSADPPPRRTTDSPNIHRIQKNVRSVLSYT